VGLGITCFVYSEVCLRYRMREKVPSVFVFVLTYVCVIELI